MFTNDISHGLPLDDELNKDRNSEESNSFEEEITFDDTEAPDEEQEEDQRPRFNRYQPSAPAFRRYSSLW